jgi:hypothetical protein
VPEYEHQRCHKNAKRLLEELQKATRHIPGDKKHKSVLFLHAQTATLEHNICRTCEDGNEEEHKRRWFRAQPATLQTGIKDASNALADALLSVKVKPFPYLNCLPQWVVSVLVCPPPPPPQDTGCIHDTAQNSPQLLSSLKLLLKQARLLKRIGRSFLASGSRLETRQQHAFDVELTQEQLSYCLEIQQTLELGRWLIAQARLFFDDNYSSDLCLCTDALDEVMGALNTTRVAIEHGEPSERGTRMVPPATMWSCLVPPLTER